MERTHLIPPTQSFPLALFLDIRMDYFPIDIEIDDQGNIFLIVVCDACNTRIKKLVSRPLRKIAGDCSCGKTFRLSDRDYFRLSRELANMRLLQEYLGK